MRKCLGKVDELYKYTITLDTDGLDEEYEVYLRHNPNEIGDTNVRDIPD